MGRGDGFEQYPDSLLTKTVIGKKSFPSGKDSSHASFTYGMHVSTRYSKNGDSSFPSRTGGPRRVRPPPPGHPQPPWPHNHSDNNRPPAHTSRSLIDLAPRTKPSSRAEQIDGSRSPELLVAVAVVMVSARARDDADRGRRRRPSCIHPAARRGASASPPRAAPRPPFLSHLHPCTTIAVLAGGKQQRGHLHGRGTSLA